MMTWFTKLIVGSQVMQTEDILAKLNDIYLPETLNSWWPLAYGWWIIVGGNNIFFVTFMPNIFTSQENKQIQTNNNG